MRHAPSLHRAPAALVFDPKPRGSLPIALTMMFLIGALGASLIAGSIAGLRHTATDSAYEAAGQTADIAVQTAMYHIQAQAPGYTTGRIQVSGGTGEQSWSADAIRDSSGGTDVWTITATGGVEQPRTFEVFVEEPPIFSFAAFGLTALTFNGGNAGTSYRSGTYTNGVFTPDPDGSELDEDDFPENETDRGRVATEGELTLNGQSYADTDIIEIFYARDPDKVTDPLPGATGYAAGAAALTSDPGSANGGKVTHYRQRAPIDLSLVESPQPTEVSFPRSSNPADNVIPAGRSYWTDMFLDGNTIVQGTPDNPSIVYYSGTARFDKDADINFERDLDGDPIVPGRPRPPATLIMLGSTDGVAVEINNRSRISASLFAPYGDLKTNAQSSWYGSMLLDEITQGGGVQFHYDEALGDMNVRARLNVLAYTEVGSTAATGPAAAGG